MIFEHKINNFVHLKTDAELFERFRNRLALLHEFLAAGTRFVPVMMAVNVFRTARELESRGYDLLAMADDSEDVVIMSRTADGRVRYCLEAEAELTAQIANG